MENSIRKHFRERLAKGEYIRDTTRDLSVKHVVGRLLEIGCGASYSYRTVGSELYGLDITREMLQVLKTRFPTCNPILGDARMLPFKDKTFDILVLPFILHHIVYATPRGCMTNMHVAMQETMRIMRDEGVAFVREDIVYNRVLSYLSFFVTALCAELHIGIDFLDIHSDVVVHFLTEKEIRRLFVNFHVELLSWKKWAFWFLGRHDVEFYLVKKQGQTKVKPDTSARKKGETGIG